MNVVKVSIIIPVYNTIKYLERCFNSVISQTLKDIEVILVDDGSDDGSGELLDKYAEKYPMIKVIHKSNGGPSSARNAGMDAASGEYIGFIDSDDFAEKEMFESMYDEARKYDVDVVICGINYYISGKGITRKEKPPVTLGKKIAGDELKSTLEKAHYSRVIWFCCRNIYSRKLLFKNNIRFNEAVKIGEDPIFNLQAYYNANAIAAMDICLYYYEENPDSLTGKYKSNLEELLSLQYKEKTQLLSYYDLGKEFYDDLNLYTATHTLPLLLDNARKSEELGRKLKIRRIVELPMIKNSIEQYSITKLVRYSKSRKVRVIVLLAKYNMINLIDFLYRFILS